MIDTLLVHLDDADAVVQKAVFGALQTAAPISAACVCGGSPAQSRRARCPSPREDLIAAPSPRYAVRKATEARQRHRSPDLCDALVRHLSGETPPAPGK